MTHFLYTFNIVCVSDESYVQHTAVMLCSLFETNRGKSFNIFLLTNGIKEESAGRLNELCRKYDSHIDIITIDDKDIKDLPVGQWSTMMYYKLFMPTVLPQDADRCLFLDVDMIINDDIETLYHWDLKGTVIAAAEDMPDCIQIKDKIGLKPEDLYINSGVMVCDLAAWRKMEEAHPIFDFVHSVKDIIINEQNVIALYFRNHLTLLPIRWNMVTFYYLRVPKIFPKYLSELREAQHHPGIIHFACPIKPWFKDCTHPFRHLYKHYLTKTVWGNEYVFPYGEQLTPRQRFNKKIKNLLKHIGLCRYDGDQMLMK